MNHSSTPRCGRYAVLVLCALIGAACATTPDTFDNRPRGDDPTERPSSEIRREEIVRLGESHPTAYMLIERLRPAWLQARGQDSMMDPDAAYPVVYIDEIRHGALFTLNMIMTSEIQRLQYVSAMDATTRWGTGHPSGVINVVTGRHR